ncbi:repressor LexA [Sediminibacterium magnilacihabitans]|nr:repressor LexA [Sediminibacterium magnilacihabitans]
MNKLSNFIQYYTFCIMSEEQLSAKAKEALKHIRNWIMKYSLTPSVRELMQVMGYKSPRSAMLLITELEENGFLERKADGSYKMVKDLSTNETARTVAVPLVGSISCGGALLAEENVEAYIPISTSLVKTGNKYFLLRAVGDSMNEAGIQPGDLVLVRQQNVAENGQRVVALIDDEATLKEFQHKGNVVALVPRSSNPKHKPIILERDFQVQGVIITSISNVNF